MRGTPNLLRQDLLWQQMSGMAKRLMGLPINKGLDFTPAQWTAAFAGFLASGGLAHVLVVQGYLSKNWAMIPVILGFGVPPAVVGWLQSRKRDAS
jgi:hypothetical protein